MPRPMLARVLPLLLFLGGAAAGRHNVRGDGGCVYPGVCQPPVSQHSRVSPVTPRQQWNIDGGYCGSLSIQTGALAHGAWLSQAVVRKANYGVYAAGHCDGGQPGHPGELQSGCEVGAHNIGATARNLKLRYAEWDYNATQPQAPAYKRWMKRHLAAGAVVVWLVMCKGDDPCPYPDACPNGGAYGHVEPVWGIYSNHSLDDPTAYPDDVIVHSSDQDLNPYYRPLHTLEDSTKMDGNCAKAGVGFGKNEMYPCINDQTDYGIAIMGLAGGAEGAPHVALAVDNQDEPDTKAGQLPALLNATVTVSNLTKGKSYTLSRYKGVENFPAAAGELGRAEFQSQFTAAAAEWVHHDPHPIVSSTAVYYKVGPRGAPQ